MNSIAKNCIKSKYRYRFGMTLLEILIYMSLFSICFASITHMVLSMQKTVEKITANRISAQINGYVYEFARYHAYKTGEPVQENKIDDFLLRMLKSTDIYQIKLVKVQVEMSKRLKKQIIEYEINNKLHHIEINLL